VAEAMGQSPDKRINNRSSLELSESREANKSMLRENHSLQKSMKLPNANVNEAKLKVILKQLKKMERN
jgi:hypothetical protein